MSLTLTFVAGTLELRGLDATAPALAQSGCAAAAFSARRGANHRSCLADGESPASLRQSAAIAAPAEAVLAAHE